MISLYKFNALMRRIIETEFGGNMADFGRKMGWSKQQVHIYWHNNRAMTLNTFRNIAEKCGYNVRIHIIRKKSK